MNSSIDSLQLNTYVSNSSYLEVNQNINSNQNKNTPEVEQNSENNNEINNAAVNVSISMQSMMVYVHVRSLEFVQNNTEAQDMLHNIFNNKDVFDFLDGRESENGMNLKSIGYEGKPITQLSAQEAKELISNEGFFGVEQTSERVSSFAINISNGDVELLKEAREGLVKGFEEAEKLWGGELPEISYETQEKTLELVDKKIDELLNKDKESKVETPAEALKEKEKLEEIKEELKEEA